MTRTEAIEILRDTPIDIRSPREDDIHTLYATAQNMAIEALSAEPIRCKDCKYKRLNDDSETKYYYCALKAHEEWSVDDTDFCSWAERGKP